MGGQRNKKRILSVCGGNTCRSPTANVIPKQKLKAIGKLGEFGIDSAAHGRALSVYARL